MAERQNTGNAIPSNAVRDFNDNTIIVDEWTNGQQDSTSDRFGNSIPTRAKLTSELTQVIEEATAAKNEAEKAAEHILSITQGPQGEKGDVGPQGEQGPQGVAGPRGEKGETVALSDSVDSWSSTVAASSTAVKTLNDRVSPLYSNIGVEPNNAGGALYLFAPNSGGRYSFQVKADGYSGLWDSARGIWLYAFDGNGYMSFGTAPSSGIGIGQSYQDVTSQRISYVTYTNTTGKPIFVMVTLSSLITRVYVGGVEILSGALSSTFIIPAGAQYSFYTYKNNGIAGEKPAYNERVTKWLELR